MPQVGSGPRQSAILRLFGQVMNVTSIGQRIHELRTERSPRLTQHELAERAGLSVDLIQKLEQGRKASARITSLMAIATALDVDLSDLLGKRMVLQSIPEHGGLLELRRAITPVNDQTTDGSAIDDLPEKISDAWRLYWKGDFDALAAMLPGVIWDARTVGDGNRLADAFALAGIVLVHLGHTDLAHTAVTKALEVADDPLMRASSISWLAWVLLNQGRPGDGATLALREVDAIQPGWNAKPPHISMWGILLTTAATSAVRDNQNEQASEMLRAAHGAAARLGEDRSDFHTMFGESKVAMLAVDCAVVAGDYVQALDRAKQMPKNSGLPTISHARHLADVAHAHARLGHYARAEELLLRIERAAPRWISYEVFPRCIVAELKASRYKSSKLEGLANRLGVN